MNCVLVSPELRKPTPLPERRPPLVENERHTSHDSPDDKALGTQERASPGTTPQKALVGNRIVPLAVGGDMSRPPRRTNPRLHDRQSPCVLCGTNRGVDGYTCPAEGGVQRRGCSAVNVRRRRQHGDVSSVNRPNSNCGHETCRRITSPWDDEYIGWADFMTRCTLVSGKASPGVMSTARPGRFARGHRRSDDGRRRPVLEPPQVRGRHRCRDCTDLGCTFAVGRRSTGGRGAICRWWSSRGGGHDLAIHIGLG